MFPKFRAVGYNFVSYIYTEIQQLDIDPWCNGLTVRNAAGAGGADVIFQGERIPPGVSIAIGGNFGEVIRGRVDLSFDGAGARLCVIRQKFYINPPFDAPPA
jgi:hypothetical protein